MWFQRSHSGLDVWFFSEVLCDIEVHIDLPIRLIWLAKEALRRHSLGFSSFKKRVRQSLDQSLDLMFERARAQPQGRPRS